MVCHRLGLHNFIGFFLKTNGAMGETAPGFADLLYDPGGQRGFSGHIEELVFDG
jgi:hypothetical protein